MPELPDVEIYVSALRERVLDQPLQRIRLGNPFILRSVDPSPMELQGKKVLDVRRLGKRIVLGLEEDLFLVIHLMIAGRLHWKPREAKLGSKNALFALDFPNGTLVLTEAGSKRRASLHLARGEEALAGFQRGGLEVLDASLEQFSEALKKENHTLKRSLTDPRLFSGIGNAYSDEILHRARLSPFKQTATLSPGETALLYEATRSVLQEWVDRLRRESEGTFPEKVTAFRPDMAVHGRYGKPCPTCGSPVQRIVYADNEANYCAACQTGGKLLADRALSRLLKDDWPRTLEELEERGPAAARKA